MKIVVVSDLHADKETIGVPRMNEVKRAVWQAVAHAARIRADAFLCLGDLTDPDQGGATLAAVGFFIEVALSLSKSDVPSIWIAGNHDVVEDGTGETTLAPMRALEDVAHVVVVERPRLVTLSTEVSLLCLPYASVAHAYDPRDAARHMMEQVSGQVVVAGHLMIPGIVPGEETLEMPRGREVVFPIEETMGASLRLNGHYHARQDFDPGDGGPPIHIPGSPMPFAFGEQDNVPAFSVIEI